MDIFKTLILIDICINTLPKVHYNTVDNSTITANTTF